MEREVLDRFLSSLEEELYIVRIDDERETPDFILYGANRNISIEHIRYVHERHKGIEEFRKRLISMAKLKLETLYMNEECIHFIFSNQLMKPIKRPKNV